MAIYGQPNTWTCGPFALRHALLAHGVFTAPEELARVAGSTEEGGTDERQLQRAARAHRVDLLVRREMTRRSARHRLEQWLARGVPVLLCVDDWEHWLTAVSRDDEHVVVLDSKYDAPLRLEGWDPLLNRIACRRHHLRGLWSSTVYDLHPVVPRRRAAARLALTPGRARALLADETGVLARRWDEFARAVLSLAPTPGVQLVLGLELEPYIGEQRERILSLVTDSLGDHAAAAAARTLDGLGFAAGMYQAILQPEFEATAADRLADMVIDLMVSDAAPPSGARNEPAAA